MAKGYWIGRVDVSSDEGYKPYAAANPAIFKKFGGRYVCLLYTSPSPRDS